MRVQEEKRNTGHHLHYKAPSAVCLLNRQKTYTQCYQPY